jgi:hypothetical protein
VASGDQSLPEFIGFTTKDGQTTAVLRVVLVETGILVELPLDESSRRAVARVFQTRPFEDLPSARYRYFTSGAWNEDARGSPTGQLALWIEQGRDSGYFRLERVPRPLATGLGRVVALVRGKDRRGALVHGNEQRVRRSLLTLLDLVLQARIQSLDQDGRAPELLLDRRPSS